MTSRSASLWAAHAAAVLFGLTGIFGALIASEAGAITLGRALFAVVGLAVLATAQGRPLLRDLDARKLVVFLVSGLLLATHWWTFFTAVKVGGVAVATLGFASFPAFIALLDVTVFRERLSFKESVLLILVTVGLVLVTPAFDFSDQGTVGLVWGLGSGLSFALLAMTNGRTTRGVDPMQVAYWQNVVVSAVMLPFAATQLFAIRSEMDWLYLGLLGVFCTGLSQYLFVKSLEGLNARSAGMIIALEPVYAIAFAWWLFSEQPSLRMLSGAALMIFAIVLAARSEPAVTTGP